MPGVRMLGGWKNIRESDALVSNGTELGEGQCVSDTFGST